MVFNGIQWRSLGSIGIRATGVRLEPLLGGLIGRSGVRLEPSLFEGSNRTLHGWNRSVLDGKSERPIRTPENEVLIGRPSVRLEPPKRRF